MDYTKYHFEKTVKMLIMLSHDVERQMEYCRQDYDAGEIVMDLYESFDNQEDLMVDRGLLTPAAVMLIIELRDFFNRKDSEFWDYMDTHADWDKVRAMAKSILKLIGKQDWDIRISYENKFSKVDFIKPA